MFPPRTDGHVQIRKMSAKSHVEVFPPKVIGLTPHRKRLEEILVFRRIIMPPYIWIGLKGKSTIDFILAFTREMGESSIKI
jgi:hypothetical protein